jgi:glycosyltransferase involved in cell wall biosynthesis
MLSVLINNYNYARFLGECIDSALSQDHPDFEVIVVDDGSTDDSRAIIESYGDRIVAVLKENGGQASSFNAGLAAARGDILLLLDADDAFLPGKLAHVEALYAAHDLEWCFDRVVTEPGTQMPDTLRLSLIDKRDAMRLGGFPTLPVPTSGLSFRRRILEQILPMPVASGVVLSDNYLKFAAAYLGKGAIVETPLTFQRLHDANRYTQTGRAKSLKPRIMIATGLHLAHRYDGLNRMGRSLVAGGISGLPVGESWQEIGRCAQEGQALGWTRSNLTGLVLKKRLANMLRGGGVA